MVTAPPPPATPSSACRLPQCAHPSEHKGHLALPGASFPSLPKYGFQPPLVLGFTEPECRALIIMGVREMSWPGLTSFMLSH